MGSSKVLYSVVNELVDNNRETVLPVSDSDEHLANEFMQYFLDKLSKLRSQFKDNNDTIAEVSLSNRNCLATFESATSDELLQIIMSFSIKCSPEDPIPAELLKRNLDTFLPIWLELVNLSPSEGSMDCLKSAVILPLING